METQSIESDDLALEKDFIIESVKRLTKDQRVAFQSLGEQEARFLVDQYYTVQDNRIATSAQIRSMTKEGEPVHVLSLTRDNYEQLEKTPRLAFRFTLTIILSDGGCWLSTVLAQSLLRGFFHISTLERLQRTDTSGRLLG